MKKINLLLLLIIVGFGFQSCEKEKLKTYEGAYKTGIFVVNEGNFTQGNSSLSFIKDDLSSIENNIYFNVNNQHLGDVSQSIAFVDDKVYIVVNNSNKIEVATKEDMKRLGTIASHLVNPRYAQNTIGNRAFVSCWGDTSDTDDDYLAVINTLNDKFLFKVPVELGPEKMVANDNYLFVAHKGAYGTNNKVTALNLSDLTKTIITVGDRPNSLVLQGHYLWVLSGGEPSWTGAETAGKLTQIDIDNMSVAQEFTFATTEHPNNLNLDNGDLYYNIGNKVYKMASTSANLPTSEYINFDGTGIYNMETNDGKLYISDAKDYQQEGDIVIYNLSDGQKQKTLTAGIIPGDFGFVE